ncbi:hypothetical protein K7G82_00605 [Sphingomonas colocasiae]|uniref:Uncharacterized protein n=1 Tax=Sphingomonas colocasiae TaxID=1848973 RepID=A0ABS7PJ48_9SPHN|nr:hypothetical protein [Sphingomonas colocasiae]
MPERYAQVTIRERVIIRVPTRQSAPAKPIKWKEKKAPRCISLNALAGAAITGEDSVDLILRGGTRLRARLDRDCPALDFYSGFYIKPTRDRRICADRDTIHARSGGQCEINSFKTLVPDR